MRIGTLGTASITPGALIEPALEVTGVEVAAVAARDVRRAEDFAMRHGIPTVHDSYEALIADDSLDAIYNPLVPSLHAKWSISALKLANTSFVKSPSPGMPARRTAWSQRAGRQDWCSWRRSTGGTIPSPRG